MQYLGFPRIARNSAADDARQAEFARVAAADGERLLAAARRILRNESDAQDALQDGLLSAWRALGEFDGRSRLSTWLHRIVMNAALMQLRRAHRHHEVDTGAELGQFATASPNRTPEAEPGERLVCCEESERITAAIRALPSGYRGVLQLRVLEDLDTRETGRLLGMSEAAVKVRLHRGLKRLRAELAARAA